MKTWLVFVIVLVAFGLPALPAVFGLPVLSAAAEDAFCRDLGHGLYQCAGAGAPTVGVLKCAAAGDPFTFSNDVRTFSGAVAWVNDQYATNPNVVVGSGSITSIPNVDGRFPGTLGYVGCVTETVPR